MSEWITASWSTLGWVVASTVGMYVATVATIRLAGRRTVAQLSAFDAVITIALGSIIAGTVLSPRPRLAQGVAALLTLLTLQVVVGWARRRHPAVRGALEFEPEVIVRDGTVDLPRGIFGSQLTDEELASRLRGQGTFDVGALALVVLEPDGTVSVVPADEADQPLVGRFQRTRG